VPKQNKLYGKFLTTYHVTTYNYLQVNYNAIRPSGTVYALYTI